MANKAWQDLTQTEKIEDLRSDVQRLFSAVNALGDDVRRAWMLARQNEESLSAVSKEVAGLKDRLPKA